MKTTKVVINKILDSKYISLPISFAVVGFLYPIIVLLMLRYILIGNSATNVLFRPLLSIVTVLSYVTPLGDAFAGLPFIILPILPGFGGWVAGKIFTGFLSPASGKKGAKVVLVSFTILVAVTVAFFSFNYGTVSHSISANGYRFDIERIEKPLNKQEIQVLLYVFSTRPSNLAYYTNMKIVKDGRDVLPASKQLSSNGVIFPLVQPPFTLSIVDVTVYDPKPKLVQLNYNIKVKKLWEDFTYK